MWNRFHEHLEAVSNSEPHWHVRAEFEQRELCSCGAFRADD